MRNFTKEDREKANNVRWAVENRYSKGNPFLALFHLLKSNSGVRRGRIKVLITWEDIESLYNSQNMRCALSGLPMILKRKSLYSISVDRIDCSGNYEKDNIRLVCQVVNTMRGILKDEELAYFCKNIIKTISVP